MSVGKGWFDTPPFLPPRMLTGTSYQKIDAKKASSKSLTVAEKESGSVKMIVVGSPHISMTGQGQPLRFFLRLTRTLDGERLSRQI